MRALILLSALGFALGAAAGAALRPSVTPLPEGMVTHGAPGMPSEPDAELRGGDAAMPEALSEDPGSAGSITGRITDVLRQPLPGRDQVGVGWGELLLVDPQGAAKGLLRRAAIAFP